MKTKNAGAESGVGVVGLLLIVGAPVVAFLLTIGLTLGVSDGKNQPASGEAPKIVIQVSKTAVSQASTPAASSTPAP